MPTTRIISKGLSTNTRTWSDLDLDFTKHPVTNDVSVKRNIESVKRSVRNLIQLNLYEKPIHPEIDGGVTRHLFGLSSAHTKYDIERAIGICLTNYEPRVQVNNISVTEDLGRNGFNITIVFTVVNSPEPIEVSLYLERVR